ncbi:unnamed protein product [Prunus armeniaca]|uniref:Syntaxin N-terminal domain-containing protein n=1 Tax=Prunus armeniaca TaxID=36596 RepID=A0A6J5TP81_PRUAR|nr:unnamed protein product [Prunus armeniaca]CAB4295601.1 unnamed protein product [Prunus armeniaca]
MLGVGLGNLCAAKIWVLEELGNLGKFSWSRVTKKCCVLEKKIRSLAGGFCKFLAKMNDLMTKSFLSYVELKKQAQKDLEANLDVEAGQGQLNPSEQENLSHFFQEVTPIKSDMKEITNLLYDLQSLNKEAKSTHSAKILRGLRDRMESDMVAVFQKVRLYWSLSPF